MKLKEKYISIIVSLVSSLFVFSACTGKTGDCNANKCVVETKYCKNSKFKAEDFKNPPSSYRVVPFWSWNEIMEPDEVRRQLRLMKQAGWGGGMIHSRTGLITEYLGEDWFKAVDACIDESLKLDMLVWLYDEDKWPSGFSGGTVLHANNDHAVKTLFARPVGEKVNISKRIKPLGSPVNGIQVYEHIAAQNNPWFNGTSYVDTMQRSAMEKFKADAYDSYYNRYKKYYGNVIVAEFTDEPAQASVHEGPANSVVYSRDLIDEFKKTYGFDPVPHFYKLFTDCEGAMKFRLQYYRTANSLFEKNFVKLLGDACDSRNIHLTGHFMAEDTMWGEHIWSGRIMPFYRHMGLPGIDHLSRQIFEVYTGKKCHSACNQYGKTRMLSELYGVSGGSLSFEDRQWITYQQMIMGVNQLVPHLSLFSQAGNRKRDYPQNINYQQCWWHLNSTIDVPLARACYALAQGKYAADILYINPQESMSAISKQLPKKTKNKFGNCPDVNKRVQQMHDSLNSTLKSLLGAQLTFDLGDEQLLQEDGFVKGNTIGIGQMTYKVVVLSEGENMRPSTLQKLQQFAKAGGIIIRTGSVAKFLDGEKSAELDAFVKSIKLVKVEDLGAELEKLNPAMVAVDKANQDTSLLWTHVRNFNDGSRFVMLANLNRFKKYEGNLKMRGNYKRVQILDIESGEIKDTFAENKNGELQMPLTLETAQAIFLRISNETPVAKSFVKENVVSEKDIYGWQAERLDDNSMLLDYASFTYDNGKKGVSGEVPAIEIMRYLNHCGYDGDVKVFYKFNVKDFDKSRKLHVVAEYLQNFTMKVNGKEVKYTGLPFWKDFRWLPVDITGMVNEGVNTIELHYKNFKHGNPSVHKPQWRRYGTEIEAVYLVGDFSVVSEVIDENRQIPSKSFKRQNNYTATFKSKPTKTNVISKNALAITNPYKLNFGNATLNGLPFYAGKLAYKNTIELAKINDSERVFVKLNELDCPVAEVIVNGKSAGVVKAAPYELDITKFAKEGKNDVKVVLYASLRNIMDAPHAPMADIYSIWPVMFTISDLPTQNNETMLKHLQMFGDGTWKSGWWKKDYSQVSFGDIGGIKLVIKK